MIDSESLRVQKESQMKLQRQASDHEQIIGSTKKLKFYYEHYRELLEEQQQQKKQQ